jgi:type VI secretion system protein ImpK
MRILGVPPQRISGSGKGDADPVGDNRTAQGRAQNRRVDIVVRR